MATPTGGEGIAIRAGMAGGGANRNSRSPRPHATAQGAPLAKKATSAPRRVAKYSSSCEGTALPASRFTAWSAAAASLEPPPNPARTGIRFVSSSATPNFCPVASSTARAARTARFSSDGPRSGPRDVSGGARDHELVRELEQREGGLDLVKPGRRFPGENAQEEIHLGVRHDPHGVRQGPAPSPLAAGSAGPTRRRSLKCSRMVARDLRPSSVIGSNVDTWYVTA